MKNIIIAAAFISLTLTGCYQYLAHHPEKTEKDYYEDKAVCESKARAWAREWAMEKREDIYADDEILHARKCMRDLGWEYRF